MSLVTDNPVVVPDRELEEDKKPSESEPPRIRCPLCGWSPRKEDSGSAPVGTIGTPLIRAACVPRACTSGLKPSAFRAADGRRILTGMPVIDSKNFGVS